MIIDQDITHGTRYQAAIYLRVACMSRGALRSQRADCQEFARRRRLGVRTVYADAGASGITIERPGLKQLLHDALRRRLRYVIVADEMRLARSFALDQEIRETLRRQGALIAGPRTTN